jgi:hypothetical protein
MPKSNQLSQQFRLYIGHQPQPISENPNNNMHPVLGTGECGQKKFHIWTTILVESTALHVSFVKLVLGTYHKFQTEVCNIQKKAIVDY